MQILHTTITSKSISAYAKQQKRVSGVCSRQFTIRKLKHENNITAQFAAKRFYFQKFRNVKKEIPEIFLDSSHSGILVSLGMNHF